MVRARVRRDACGCLVCNVAACAQTCRGFYTAMSESAWFSRFGRIVGEHRLRRARRSKSLVLDSVRLPLCLTAALRRLVVYEALALEVVGDVRDRVGRIREDGRVDRRLHDLLHPEAREVLLHLAG